MLSLLHFDYENNHANCEEFWKYIKNYNVNTWTTTVDISWEGDNCKRNRQVIEEKQQIANRQNVLRTPNSHVLCMLCINISQFHILIHLSVSVALWSLRTVTPGTCLRSQK